MKVFDIVTDTKILNQISKEVTLPLSKEDENLLYEMVEYLKNTQNPDKCDKYDLRPGVGLAAIQLGVAKRMLAVYLTEENNKITTYALVNPKIVSNSIKECYLGGGEGCLSVPVDVDGYVYRYFKVTIKAYDALSKKTLNIKARGYLAIILQHELDHLDGILYYEKINKDDPFIKKVNSEII